MLKKILKRAGLTLGRDPQDYDAGDWVRAIRHGLQYDGTPLIYMPSGDYNQLSDTDLKAIIAYCSQVPPWTVFILLARLA